MISGHLLDMFMMMAFSMAFFELDSPQSIHSDMTLGSPTAAEKSKLLLWAMSSSSRTVIQCWQTVQRKPASRPPQYAMYAAPSRAFPTAWCMQETKASETAAGRSASRP